MTKPGKIMSQPTQRQRAEPQLRAASRPKDRTVSPPPRRPMTNSASIKGNTTSSRPRT
jgi:hypothetical protein